MFYMFQQKFENFGFWGAIPPLGEDYNGNVAFPGVIFCIKFLRQTQVPQWNNK